ncbi:AAA family ATPase [Amycolatopsis cihanbeyliensis]|uniref:AAA domain-containing protein n=1 Tax=Amycolatopsis cihanbeyliensis TaxID=1128664 RepID=A0A542DG64_AMYCI|nr:AAA family ATPase [Amycolatopsis cihanbeyliensis]TQJ02060.1 AAA domain-containing protein [Amycolatopsis cihanbeyliensis]
MDGTQDSTRETRGHVDRLGIRLERRALLVVAGLPGAGKSTLLRVTGGDTALTVLDTDQVRARLRPLLPAGTPYSWYRPLVHLLHLARLAGTAIRAPGPIVVHDPATGPVARAAFVALGLLTGRTRHLLWLDCTVAEALEGQRARGRVLLGWSFSRHVRHLPRVRSLLRGGTPRGWCEVTVIDRPTARRGLHVTVGEPLAGSPTVR